MATRTELKVSPVYIDEVPVITDVGRGMVGVTNTISGCQRIMPFDVFSAYIDAGLRFRREWHTKRQLAAVVKLPAKRRC